MTDIAKVDPNFSAQSFLDFCKNDVIPNVLEAIAQNKEDIVKDWCSEAVGETVLWFIKRTN